MKYENMPPYAPVLMESTRAIGYNLEAAVADIVDNSIAAMASEVNIFFSPYDAVPYVTFLDDGVGMNETEINNAMRYGSKSSLDERDRTDLGRFGLGLKTASLSQCRSLTVISKQNTRVEGRKWDLDSVYTSGEWSLIVLDESDIKSIPQYKQLESFSHGTLIIWEKLDRMLEGAASPEKLMNKKIDDVREHLALVFHRYISGESGIQKLKISINNFEIKAKDPFLIGRSTVFQHDEKLSIEGEQVLVSAYMLPHISKMTRAEKEALGGSEGLTKNQGFYVYRNKRLLVWGTWFRMHRKDELSKLARIRVDIPNSLDHLWTLDIRKSTAVPPDVIKRNLERIVERISNGSKRAWTFRGKREISDQGCHLWNKEQAREGVQYVLNRDHVFLKMLSESLDSDQKHILFSYLKLVEGNLPLNQLYVDLNNEERVNVRKEKDAEAEAMDFAKIILENIKDSSSRKEQIQLMLQTDPFCNYKSIVEMLTMEYEL
ncbi:ATP-binding protein [Ruminococcus albus]|uniref:ATP-binding region ATPase domain protein n=1 Tax=Ruminococcus albus (strain ATCC 27210 / DSM 20455 / JCM 14654 / NCDO 2250 / 7) TaxID=697329 RepID=E6UHK1_RUMA7|nr:ATP-binding protein [Ruminococcus albus]ADU21246.1 ATP-binding region ATPase domain protein [Ruminococcus albus 7 = DSM 20455]